mmetsp:Transcript_2098/g.4099  ORF Transcript_2098/g.4099 Transcript_2098/m.4099 type:complete len:89 (+) Transcript_2098:166-432(+)|eukprot:scaffold311_cov173-Amphora_coffeaeformis.AAC.12
MGCQTSQPARDMLDDSLHKIRAKAKMLQLTREVLTRDDESLSSSLDSETREALLQMKRSMRQKDAKKHRPRVTSHCSGTHHSDTGSGP